MGKLKRRSNFRKGNLADFIVDHNKLIRNIVIVLVVFFAFFAPFVGINYDLTSYLPSSEPSKIAIDKMDETFGYPGTGRLMLKDVSIYEAKQYKDRIEKLDGVDQIIWCDLTTQIYGSSEFIDYDDIDDYYKDGDAVMDITFKGGDASKFTHRTIDQIHDIIGDKGELVGMSPTNKFVEENVSSEMKMILVIAVSMIFVILLVTTTSWFEPILFLTVIGCAVVLNKGSNIFLGTISYITNNICIVLQLATSMDYSIFLLHSYERERENGLDKVSALKKGLNSTITTILASSLTTFFGFIVLVFMKFTIGFDMGVVMAKSIICSLLMVIFLMPSLLLSWSDLIDKYRHKSFIPDLKKFSEKVVKIGPTVVIVSLALAGPIYVGQSMNNFMYGTDATGAGPGTEIYEATNDINAKFGRSNMIVAIFPDTDAQREKEMSDEIEDKEYVTNVMGLSAYLPDGVSENILPESVRELFHKDGYARLLIYIATRPESKTAYKDTNEISDIINKYYPEDSYITGNTPVTMDMERVLGPDYRMVNALAMTAIFIVVALSFHSPVMSIAAMIPIMMAIYTNMIFPYLEGQELIFIAYAVVSCIQLGATIDYAISETSNYLQIREVEHDKRKAAVQMTEVSFPSILTSGTILVVCGYTISFASSIPAISEVGHLVGRGAVLSMFFVTCMMPAILRLIDPFITKSRKQRREERKVRIAEAKANKNGATVDKEETANEAETVHKEETTNDVKTANKEETANSEGNGAEGEVKA
ncbi:MAG: MMPL family transporter [Lachnospiraceae bacterium]|nr:MMPL family transporter [Lachnospiraceae bacterium]